MGSPRQSIHVWLACGKCFTSQHLGGKQQQQQPPPIAAHYIRRPSHPLSPPSPPCPALQFFVWLRIRRPAVCVCPPGYAGVFCQRQVSTSAQDATCPCPAGKVRHCVVTKQTACSPSSRPMLVVLGLNRLMTTTTQRLLASSAAPQAWAITSHVAQQAHALPMLAPQPR